MELEKQYQDITDKQNAKIKEFNELSALVDKLTEEIVKYDDKQKRKDLSQRITEAINEQEITKREIDALNRQRKIAYVAIFQDALDRAEAERNSIHTRINELKNISFKVEDDMKAKRREMKNTVDMRVNAIENQRDILMRQAEVNVLEGERSVLYNTIRRCKIELDQALKDVATW